MVFLLCTTKTASNKRRASKQGRKGSKRTERNIVQGAAVGNSRTGSAYKGWGPWGPKLIANTEQQGTEMKTFHALSYPTGTLFFFHVLVPCSPFLYTHPRVSQTAFFIPWSYLYILWPPAAMVARNVYLSKTTAFGQRDAWMMQRGEMSEKYLGGEFCDDEVDDLF